MSTALILPTLSSKRYIKQKRNVLKAGEGGGRLQETGGSKQGITDRRAFFESQRVRHHSVIHTYFYCGAVDGMWLAPTFRVLCVSSLKTLPLSPLYHCPNLKSHTNMLDRKAAWMKQLRRTMSGDRFWHSYTSSFEDINATTLEGLIRSALQLHSSSVLVRC